MSIGDINSTEKGTAARYNTGKPRMGLIPLDILATTLFMRGLHSDVGDALEHVGYFQGGGDVVCLYNALDSLKPLDPDLALLTAVLEFGANKYAPNNWKRGMAWSVCFDCIARHATKMCFEQKDSDSGIDHVGHIEANILFLIYYAEHYKEGDDRTVITTKTETPQ